MLGVTLVEIRRFVESLTGDTGDTVVVAEGEADLAGVAEAIAEIAGERAIQKIVVGALAVGLEVGGGDGVVESAEQTAELGAAAAGAETAAFPIDAELGHARIAAMGEELDDAVNGVGTVDGAFGAADDFDFVDVLEREAGEIDGCAGRVDGRAIDEDFGEIGIAAVEEDGGSAPLRASAADGNAGGEEESIGQEDGLPGFDFLFCDDRDGSGGLIDQRWLGLRGDDDAR